VLELTTFSIVARCPRTQMLGVAVSTALPAVGSLCPFAKAGVGAIASQAFVNPYLGLDGLRLLEDGLDAETVLERLLSDDPDRAVRQLGVVDRDGSSAAFTGNECRPWFGHITGDGFTVQGNLLVGEETIAAMAHVYKETGDEELPERLMLVLEAGQAGGGDSRGRQSAAMVVVNEEEYPFLSLRVDDDPDPVAELRRVFETAKVQLLPFMEMLPTRARPEGNADESVIEMVLKPPAERTTPQRT
jgi:uncharacterized Ntn-hydrolase superfamily protein